MNKLTSYPFNKRNPFEKQKENKTITGTACFLDRESAGDEIVIIQEVKCRITHMPRMQFISVRKVNEKEFKRIFMNGIRHVYHLKPVTVKILDYVIHELKPDSSGFQLKVQACINEIGCSQASVFRALGELCGAKIIARGCSETHYYLNSAFMGNDKNVSFAQSFVTESSNTKEMTRKPEEKESKK